MTTPLEIPEFPRPLSLARLRSGEPYSFVELAEPHEMAAAAARLDALSIRKLRFEGTLRPVGKRDWRLQGTVGATVTQACVVTLEPVTTRIDSAVSRLYSASAAQVPDGAELGPEDDIEVEPLPEEIDLGEIALEVLALALPPYPRAEAAALPEAATDPQDPGPEARENPFAALSALKDKLGKPDE
ncbi:MAG: DUF177 domain-containing protein [Pseudomonadota bacterium]